MNKQYSALLLTLMMGVAHSRGSNSINLSVVEVFPTANIEINTPVAVRFTWAAPDATGTVTLSSGNQECTATLPIDSCVIFPDTLGLQNIMVAYSGDDTYVAESVSTDITTIPRSFPQVVAYPDGTAPAWHHFGDGESKVLDMTSDGRYILFVSIAENLVESDNNGVADIFLFDRLTGTKEIVSLSDDDMPLNDGSFNGSITDDGRYIAFASLASNATSDDVFPNNLDVFIRDRTLGTTTLISRTSTVGGVSEQANSRSFNPSIAAIGPRVAFTSTANNLDPLDTDTSADIYVYDLPSQTLTLVSIASSGIKETQSSSNPMINAMGEKVVFESRSNALVDDDQNSSGSDVFVKDLTDSSIELVNVLEQDMNINQSSFTTRLLDFTDDGNRVLFQHDNQNWFNNTEGVDLVFMRDLTTLQTHLISQNNLGELPDKNILSARISGNGEEIFLISNATNLDSTFVLPVFSEEIYRHNFVTSTTTLLNGAPILYANETTKLIADNIAIDDEGSFIAFNTNSNRLATNDYNHDDDVFYWQNSDLSFHAISQGSPVLVAGQPANSTNSTASNFTGQIISFEASSSNFIVNDNNDEEDAFIRDLNTGELTLISRSNNGDLGNDEINTTSITDDGRFTVFESLSRNLGWVVPDKSSDEDLYMYDRETQQLSPISINTFGEMGNSDSENANISFDGRWVVFDSRSSDLIDNDTNGFNDVFIRDTWENLTARLSNGMTGETNERSELPDITPDGRFVVFHSVANNILANDTNDSSDVFLYDRELQTYTLISVDSNGVQGNDDSSGPVISADGSTIAFISDASNFDVIDTNGRKDAYLHDLNTGQTSWISSVFTTANRDVSRVRISHDGRFVAYETSADNVLFNDTDGENDVYIYDTLTAQTQFATVNAMGENSDDSTRDFDLSGNGRFIVFESVATNMVNNSITPNADILRAHNPFLADAPIPAGDAFVIDEDVVLTVDAQSTQAMSLLDNDSDPNDDMLSVSSPVGAFEAEGIGGQVTINSDGTFTYTPPTDQFGLAYFYYYVSDGMEEVQSFAKIDVISANDPPSFSNLGDVNVDEDSGAYSQVWASDFSTGPDDESAQMLSSTTQVTDTTGGLSFVQSPNVDEAGVLTFETTPDSSGQATVMYTLMDDGGDNNSTEVIFDITVNPVNDAPTFDNEGDVTVSQDSGLYQQPWASNISAGPADESTQNLSFNTQITGISGDLSFSQVPQVDASGILSFRPAIGAFGEAEITVTLMDDGGGDTDSTSVTFTIQVLDIIFTNGFE